MDDRAVPGENRMRLRFAGRCHVCGVALPANTEAVYERSTRAVRCVSHGRLLDDSPASIALVDSGTPGASARREFERRTASRKRRIRSRHPKLGRLVHAFSVEPASTMAWDTGALGEEKLGNRLNELASDALYILHDRRVPGSRGNIDHLVVTGTGVYVIDAKMYRGRPRLQVEGGLFRPRVEKLMVGSRDCTKLVDGVLKQVDLVRGGIADGVPVHGVLCFVEADWPLMGGSFTIRGVEALWPKKLYPKLRTVGPLGIDSLIETHRRLASAMPPA